MTRSGESSITDAIADSLGFVGQVIGIVAICAMLWLISRFLSKGAELPEHQSPPEDFRFRGNPSNGRVYSIKDCTIEWETDPYTFNKGGRYTASLVMKTPEGEVVGHHEYSGDRSLRTLGVLKDMYDTESTPKAEFKGGHRGIRTSLMAAAFLVDYCWDKPRKLKSITLLFSSGKT